ncbi:MAG: FecR domain-containing protein [Leptospiraceae bacterium]|nr:FecR domain-containing protein [Leptospiraceae bacterium]MDW8305492.1 FecR domain-containing protein [Leptospiraceae bacterium]
MKEYRKKWSLIIATMILGLMVQCKKAQEQAAAYHGVFTFIKGEVLRNGVGAKTGDKVMAADKIEVKEKSVAVLQFATDAQVTLSAGTTITLDQLNRKGESPEIHLMQNSGTSFSKVLAKGSDYKVSTPTLVAGVRGTSFALTVDRANPKKITLRLLEGKLQASHTQDPGQVVMLEAGQKIEAEGTLGSAQSLSEEEKNTLEQLNQIAMLDEAALQKVGESTPAVPPEKVEAIEKIAGETPQAEAQKPVKLTLEDLKKKYGRLSRITTKDGKEYIGAFKQQEKFIIINTVDGIVKLPVEKVAKISPFQG